LISLDGLGHEYVLSNKFYCSCINISLYTIMITELFFVDFNELYSSNVNIY
jgi:hypothetical protein